MAENCKKTANYLVVSNIMPTFAPANEKSFVS